MKYPRCLTVLPCYDWSKKGYIKIFWLDLRLDSSPFAFQFVCNSAVNSNSPLVHPSTNLCVWEFGYLTDYALDCTVALCLE